MSKVDDDALDWVARQSAQPLNPDEQAAFDTWYAASSRHQGAYLRASAIQHSLDQVTVQESLKPLRASWSSPDFAPEPQPVPAWESHAHPTLRGRRGFVVGGALAAGLAALAVVSLRPQAVEPTILVTAKGEFRKVPLADRSVVSMNSGSELAVDMAGTERRIALKQGEAWFEVAKDKSRPFIVSAGEVRVRAVGTAFAVRRHANGADILVTEGVVEVWSGEGTGQKQRLKAGAQAFVDGHGGAIDMSLDPDDIERKLAWRSGKLLFRNQPLSEAAADFNRYNVRQIVIADPALRSKTLVGQYRLDQPEYFANDVRTLLRVPVDVTPERITIGTATAPDRSARR